jgi:hypothetical protein
MRVIASPPIGRAKQPCGPTAEPQRSVAHHRASVMYTGTAREIEERLRVEAKAPTSSVRAKLTDR